MKKRSIKSLKRELDKLFSIFIRQRDKGKCYTCGTKKHWKAIDAGHYLKRQHYGTRWDERNVHGQCLSCNRFKGGRMDKYALRLEKDYGQGILQELEKKKQEFKSLKVIELKKLIEKYKN